MQVADTVEMDDGGRCVLDDTLRRTIGLDDDALALDIHATVVWPGDHRGNNVTFAATASTQGRFTIPQAKRQVLGVDGERAILQLVVSTTEPDTPPDL